mmetsp:Transcript_16824/g.25130  ORF Transcript_16824/g.25130 Transcript_16824/m.25130 type:complete len:240 (-) Transcript_16824:9-728(-)
MATNTPKESKTHWVALESNPEMFTKFAQLLGSDTSKMAFCDCFGLDDELLAWVPKPCKALIFLFPSNKFKDDKAAQAEKIEKEGQKISENLFYMKQLVGNACGSVACVHALANMDEKYGDDTFMGKFLAKTAKMTPQERGEYFGVAEDIDEIAEKIATDDTNQTAAPDADADIQTHFITFVQVDGDLYELDGRKKFPINHGSSSAETFLKDAAKVIKENWISKQPNEAFSIITYAGVQS